MTQTRSACRDPKDDQVLELAVCGRADWIVTGDAELLVLDPFPAVIPQAAESNANPEVIATLLNAGADASVRGWGGETLLHRAARGGSPDVVSLLLRAGADVHAVDGGGSTPLHEAARRNTDPAVVELLLDAVADVHVVGSGTQVSVGCGPSTPLHLAARNSPESAVVAALLASRRGGPECQR